MVRNQEPAHSARARAAPGLVRAAAGQPGLASHAVRHAEPAADSLFVAWQPDHWLLSADALITPADRGRIVTLGVQWQGDRLRLNAAWRLYGGPANSLFAQLPQRGVGVLAAAWAF
jgi:hypothetical protein